VKIYRKSEHIFYHGTDSPPFEEYDPSKAIKGEQCYNPLGEAMYVTDKADFADMFGKNVYEVRVPEDAIIKRINSSRAASVIGDILNRALKRVGIDYWEGTDISFKVEYNKLLKRALYSPYDAIIEASELVRVIFPDKAKEYSDWVAKIASQKFSKFDVIIFTGTNNPNDIFIGETPTKEILIFNKSFQKIFGEY